MKKVLYINGNPQAEAVSYSRRVANYYIDQLKKDSNVEVEVINVYEDYIPLIDQDVLSAWGLLGSGGSFDELSEDQQGKVGRMGQVLAQFKGADEYVIATPLWNFGVPPMLKAFIDNVTIAGETFKYNEEGQAIGLLGDKKATIVQASGGVYSEGPAAAYEHGVSYLETVLGFIGITNVSKVRIEGVAIPGKSDEERIAEANKNVDGLLDFDLV